MRVAKGLNMHGSNNCSTSWSRCCTGWIALFFHPFTMSKESTYSDIQRILRIFCRLQQRWITCSRYCCFSCVTKNYLFWIIDPSFLYLLILDKSRGFQILHASHFPLSALWSLGCTLHLSGGVKMTPLYYIAISHFLQ